MEALASKLLDAARRRSLRHADSAQLISRAVCLSPDPPYSYALTTAYSSSGAISCHSMLQLYLNTKHRFVDAQSDEIGSQLRVWLCTSTYSNTVHARSDEIGL
eukprot:COSAG01_NODE_5344_length_4322_cov_10.094956_3_plen_103_part_00